MAAFDGGDGSVLTGDPDEAAASVSGAVDERSQDSASNSREQAEDEGRGQKRGFSNSTSGRWDSSASWGDWDHHWEDSSHWGGQWKRDDWHSWQSGWQWSWNDRDGNQDDEDCGEDDDEAWGPDPWAVAWERKQVEQGDWRGGRRDVHRGGERRGADRGPEADGRADHRRERDQPERHREKATVWSGWKHFTNGDWSDHGSIGSDESRKSSAGRPSEKLTVPGFSGEDTEDVGTSARSYLRQIEAWRRMTLLPEHQQGLVLYQHLSGKAWVAAEELSVDSLAKETGVEYLVRWITNRYLHLEVTRIGKAFSEFFRKLRRKPGQSIRDYNSEYDRLHARLREVGCNLPEDCAAWLYVDRLQLEEAAELNLLASVGNSYSLPRLQQAAVIHDRGHRKPWESNTSGKGRKPYTAHYTEADGSLESGEEDIDVEEGDGGVPEEVAVAYATYQTAKQKYKEHQKNRGYNGGFGENKGDGNHAGKNNEKANEKIKLMKAKSFCSGCGRRGHWHKDAECPHNQPGYQKGSDKSSGKTADIGYCNLLPAEVFSIKLESANLLGITDTACARTVAGTQWLQAYSDRLAAMGAKPELKKECEAYRFGTGKIYYSSFYVVLAFELGSKIVQVRTSIISGDVPLLLSKTVLAKLGMVFDIEKGQADFNKVGLKGFDLLVTSSGHPASPIVATKMDGDPGNFQAEDLKLVPKSEYTAFALEHSPGHVSDNELYNFFYDKKLEPGIKEMLVQERLSQEEFITWWSSSTTTSDFWLECEHAWIRIHVTPRKVLFNPATWKTRATIQREMLVQTAAEIRVTDGVCCTSGRWIETVVDRWEHGKINEPAFEFHWVGRTWIAKRRAPSCSLYTRSEHGTGAMQASSHQPHEQDAAAGRGEPHGGDRSPHLGGDRDKGLHHGGPRCAEVPRPHRADEEGVTYEPGGVAHQGERAQDRVQQCHYKRQSSSPDKGLAQHPRSRTHEDREIQGPAVLRNPEKLRRVGSERAGPSRQPGPGVGEVGTMVQQQTEEAGDEGLRVRGDHPTISEFYGGHAEVNEPLVHFDGQRVLESPERQGQRFIHNWIGKVGEQ